MKLLVVGWGAPFLNGCASMADTAQRHAISQLKCEAPTLFEVEPGLYDAAGCGRTVKLSCVEDDRGHFRCTVPGDCHSKR